MHGTATTLLALEAIDVVMGPSAARGFRIEGPGATTVDLYASSVTDGQAPEGGNIWIGGATSVLFLTDSVVSLGYATVGDGGGIYCESGAVVSLDRGSDLHTNTAVGSGGGAFMDGCQLGVSSGWDGIPGGPNSAIYFNEAMTGKGGGIAAVGGAAVTLLGSEPGKHVFLSENFAAGVAGGSGGGLSLEGAGTQATIWNSWIDGNRSHMEGGGVYVGSGTYFMMEVNPLNCWPGRGCSKLVDDDLAASGGGGIVVMPGAEAHIRRTEVSGNYTGGGGSGAAVAITGAGATLHIEGCEFFRNFHAPPEGTESPRIFAGPSSTLTVAFSTIVEDLVAPGMAVLREQQRGFHAPALQHRAGVEDLHLGAAADPGGLCHRQRIRVAACLRDRGRDGDGSRAAVQSSRLRRTSEFSATPKLKTSAIPSSTPRSPRTSTATSAASTTSR